MMRPIILLALCAAFGTAESPEQEQPERGPARVHERIHWLLGSMSTVLIIGGVRLYRRGR